MKCGRTYSWKNTATKHHREQIWFQRWIIEGYSYRQLHQQSGWSAAKLQQIVRLALLRPPQIQTNLSAHSHVIFDGTYLTDRRGLVALMDAAGYRMIFGAYGVTEGSKDSRRFFQALKDRGFNPISATVDGNPHVINVFRSLWPAITIQRCLVHIQRQGLMWCRRFPKRTDGKHLRRLFLMVPFIETPADRIYFLREFLLWEKRFGRQLDETPENGWVISDLKRAVSMLRKAIPNMFHYLDDKSIPRSTNGLEGYFARLKNRYCQHRGLAQHRLANYFQWYFFLRPR